MARLLLSKWLLLMWRSGLLRKSGLLGQEGIKACRHSYYLVLHNACCLLLASFIVNFWVFRDSPIYWRLWLFRFWSIFVQSGTNSKSPLLCGQIKCIVYLHWWLLINIQKHKLLAHMWFYNNTRVCVCVHGCVCTFARNTFNPSNQRKVYPSTALCMCYK